MTEMQTSKSHPPTIHAMIQADHTLLSITKKSAEIQSANKILARILPDDLKKHCVVANIRFTIITLTSDSATWATHLRYYHQPILDALHKNENFTHVRSIQHRIQPQRLKQTKPARTLTMSRQVSQSIQACAESVKNTKLKDALLKLAKNAAV